MKRVPCVASTAAGITARGMTPGSPGPAGPRRDKGGELATKGAAGSCKAAALRPDFGTRFRQRNRECWLISATTRPLLPSLSRQQTHSGHCLITSRHLCGGVFFRETYRGCSEFSGLVFSFGNLSGPGRLRLGRGPVWASALFGSGYEAWASPAAPE